MRRQVRGHCWEPRSPVVQHVGYPRSPGQLRWRDDDGRADHQCLSIRKGLADRSDSEFLNPSGSGRRSAPRTESTKRSLRRLKGPPLHKDNNPSPPARCPLPGIRSEIRTGPDVDCASEPQSISATRSHPRTLPMHNPFLNAALAEHHRADSMAPDPTAPLQRSARRSRCGARPRGEREAMNEIETDVVVVGRAAPGRPPPCSSPAGTSTSWSWTGRPTSATPCRRTPSPEAASSSSTGGASSTTCWLPAHRRSGR